MIWTEQDIQAVWDKGQAVDRFNAARWRKDACGAWIAREQYGNHDSLFGWEIDADTAEPGSETAHLRPLHWKNAAARRNGTLVCRVTGYGGANIET